MDLCIVNPPEMAGYVSDRDKAGGIGVARPYKKRWRTSYVPPTPAMDLLYALALAEEEGIACHFVDAIAHRWNQTRTIREIVNTKPSHVGVRVSLPSLEEDLALANAIVQKLPSARVFLFGQAIKTTHSTWLENFRGDAAFYGEVEALLLPYLRGLNGLAVLRPGEALGGCLEWQSVDNLDELPFPAWHRVDTAAYSPTGRQADFVYYILTSRGCPKGCAMCPYYIHQGKVWRARSIDNIVGEFEHLRLLGARLVQTRDPNISWRKQHLLALAERLQGQTHFSITTETDLEALSRGDLEKLKAAGFTRIMTGVESVDEAVLREIHQNGQALKRSLENMTTCAELGIRVTGFFIVGALTENWRSVRSTVETARRLPCEYSVSLMTPYPGTETRDAFIAAGFHRETRFHFYNGYTGMVRTHGLDYAEVNLAHAWASAELELVTRERLWRDARGVERVLAQGRLWVQQGRLLPLRNRVRQAALKNEAHQAPERHSA
ncbi:MAG: radical SAM protein [Candidatus Sericytochromatia bacterium]|nr:radical SAM protein [Candidatus Sericytochromatia bacterium]